MKAENKGSTRLLTTHGEKASPEILVLAGGRATRFGADKRLVRVSDRETLLERTVTQLQSARLPVTVCLAARASDDGIARALRSTGVTVLRCRRADEGMGGTLAEAVAQRREASALVIALGDMPLVSAPIVDALCRHWSPGAIVAPVGPEGRRGHPVLFDRQYFAELCELGGDRGAASLISKYRGRCVEVPVDDPGIYLDADTPEALEALRAQLASRSSSGVSG